MTQAVEAAEVHACEGGESRGGPGRIAFVVSQFPETHETFILREFVALAERGLNFVILSLKPCKDSVIQKDAYSLLDRTFYPSSAGKGPADGAS